MDSWEEWKDDHEEEKCVNESDDRTDPPRGVVQGLEDENVSEREHHSVDEVNEGSVESRAIAVSSEDASDKQREAHSGCTKSLTDALHGRQNSSGNDGPK